MEIKNDLSTHKNRISTIIYNSLTVDFKIYRLEKTTSRTYIKIILEYFTQV